MMPVHGGRAEMSGPESTEAQLPVEVFLRGTVFPGDDEVPYPRALTSDVSRLPADTWSSAQRPVGVRIEVAGTAHSVEVEYVAHSPDLRLLPDTAACSFSVWAGQRRIAQEPADAGTHRLVLPVAEVLAAGADRATIYLPDAMTPRVIALRAIGGTLSVPAVQPRWIAYGDSITEGWVASDPGLSWPARLGRTLGLDTVNLGYAGAARGEVVTAEQIAGLDTPEVISLSYGTNCWTRVPFRPDQLAANLEVFIDVVRSGHPEVPILVLSPVMRPDAESTPNRLGASQAHLRVALEAATRARMDAGDTRLVLVSGSGLLTADRLPDGVHPDDVGHGLIADAVRGPLAQLLQRPIPAAD